MLVDPLTTSSMLMVASAAMSMALWASSRRQPAPVGASERSWARALVCAPVGWLLLVLAGQPSLGMLAILGKALIMASFMGYLHALLLLRGNPLPVIWRHLPVVGVALLSTGFYFLWPDTPMRSGLLSVLCALVALACAVVSQREVRQRPKRSAHGRLVSVAFLISALILGLRALLLFLPEASTLRAWADEPAAHTLLLGIPMLAPLVASLGLVLMGSDRLLDRLEAIANTDSLTGLAARQAFMNAANAAIGRASRAGGDCALLAIDVDHFKRINDSHGHAVGDRALIHVADTLRRHSRQGDCIGRIGGEEFALILPDNGQDEALALAQRLCLAVSGAGFDVGGQPLPLHISIGVSCRSGPDDSLDAMALRADQALYQAKRTGRNRAVAWQDTPAFQEAPIQIRAA